MVFERSAKDDYVFLWWYRFTNDDIDTTGNDLKIFTTKFLTQVFYV